MQDKRVALITGANQGVGLQVAKELGLSVLVGSRNFARGKAAAMEIAQKLASLRPSDVHMPLVSRENWESTFQS